MLHPTTQIRTSPMHATTPEGAESPTNRSGTGLRRSKPVDSSQKPNWSRYRDRQLGKSDPSLSPEVRKSTCTYMCYTCASTLYTVCDQLNLVSILCFLCCIISDRSGISYFKCVSLYIVHTSLLHRTLECTCMYMYSVQVHVSSLVSACFF